MITSILPPVQGSILAQYNLQLNGNNKGESRFDLTSVGGAKTFITANNSIGNFYAIGPFVDGSYFSLNAATLAKLSNLNSWTVEVNLNITTFAAESYPFIMRNSTTAADHGIAVRTNNKVSWLSGGVYKDSSVNFTTGRWHKFIFSFDGTTLKIYQDNVKVFDAVAVNTVWNTMSNGTVGVYWSNGLASFKGFMNNLKIKSGATTI